MKRAATLFALAAIVVVPAVSDAAPKRVERTVTFAYQGFCDAGTEAATFGGPSTCPTAAKLVELVKKGESYVKFSAVDETTGEPVMLRYYNSSDFAGTVTSHCGESGTKPLKVKSGQEMAWKISLDPTCGAVPTTGTLTVVFSNLP